MQLQTLPNAPIESFIDSVTEEIGKLISSEVSTSTALTRFHALRMPTVSLRQYVERVTTYAPCSVECFVISLVYLRRIIKNQGASFVNPLTVHRLFLASVLLAAKYCDDLYFNNRYYARVGGIPCDELNALEIEFLFRCQFECNVSMEDFDDYGHVLQAKTLEEKVTSSEVSFSVSPHTHSFMFPSCRMSSKRKDFENSQTLRFK